MKIPLVRFERKLLPPESSALSTELVNMACTGIKIRDPFPVQLRCCGRTARQLLGDLVHQLQF